MDEIANKLLGWQLKLIHYIVVDFRQQFYQPCHVLDQLTPSVQGGQVSNIIILEGCTSMFRTIQLLVARQKYTKQVCVYCLMK